MSLIIGKEYWVTPARQSSKVPGIYTGDKDRLGFPIFKHKQSGTPFAAPLAEEEADGQLSSLRDRIALAAVKRELAGKRFQVWVMQEDGSSDIAASVDSQSYAIGHAKYLKQQNPAARVGVYDTQTQQRQWV